MKYLVIGDIHGKLELVQELLSDNFKEYHKIFVGDFLDSFDRSSDACVQTLRTVLNAVVGRKNVTALLGNHELSYIRSGMQCSGYDTKTEYHIKHLKAEVLRWFKRYVYITDEILVTHAGATEQLFPNKKILKEKLEADDPSLYNIGRYRGGHSPVGGIFWCDYWAELEPIEGLTQIVGHSAARPQGRYEGVVSQVGIYNIDCLDRITEALVVDTADSSLKVINFMDKDYE